VISWVKTRVVVSPWMVTCEEVDSVSHNRCRSLRLILMRIMELGCPLARIAILAIKAYANQGEYNQGRETR
jgi:hypothetical protein